MGVVDIAGSGPVHLLGGASALAAGIMLGPRLNRYDKGADAPQMGNPINACVGLFFLWWGWLAFNSGLNEIFKYFALDYLLHEIKN